MDKIFFKTRIAGHFALMAAMVMLLTACPFLFDPEETETPEKPAEAVGVTGVTLNASTAALSPGGTFDLTATVAPADAKDRSVKWSSNATARATVAATGNLTARVTIPASATAGEAVITVTTGDGGKTATCRITVSTGGGKVAVTKVTVEPATAKLAVNETLPLKETVEPANATDKTVKWSTSDATIATVSASGVVTGVKAGNATITVTTNDGGHKATCSVTVTAPGGEMTATLKAGTVCTDHTTAGGKLQKWYYCFDNYGKQIRLETVEGSVKVTYIYDEINNKYYMWVGAYAGQAPSSSSFLVAAAIALIFHPAYSLAVNDGLLSKTGTATIAGATCDVYKGRARDNANIQIEIGVADHTVLLRYIETAPTYKITQEAFKFTRTCPANAFNPSTVINW